MFLMDRDILCPDSKVSPVLTLVSSLRELHNCDCISLPGCLFLVLKNLFITEKMLFTLWANRSPLFGN